MDRIRSGIAYGNTRSIFNTSATYNSAGLTFMIVAMTQENTTKFFYNDRIPMTGERLVLFLEESRPELALVYPTTLELILGLDNETEPNDTGRAKAGERLRRRGLSILKSCSHGVGNFGAVCPQRVGDELVREGVRFFTGYACSEASRIMSSASRPEHDVDWDYMSINLPVRSSVHMKPLSFDTGPKCDDLKISSSMGTPQKQEEQQEPELYECIILPSNPNLDNSITNTSDPEPGSFATGDVFRPHPTKPNRWKIIGRKEDHIFMDIPVVVNALEYENIIKAELAQNDKSNNDKVRAEVEEVVVFGQGRPKLGVLVFPKHAIASSHSAASPSSSVDVGERKDREKMIRDEVWHAIQVGINDKMKTGIDKDMIVIIDPAGGQSQLARLDKDQEGEDGEGMTRTRMVPRTDKLNFIRSRINLLYGKEIEWAYASAAS